MVNGLDSTEGNLPRDRTTEGGESRLWYAHLFKMSLLKQSDEQERMRSGRMWLGTGWSPDLVVQCGALSLLPDSSQGSEHQAAAGEMGWGGSPLKRNRVWPRCLYRPRGQPCLSH